MTSKEKTIRDYLISGTDEDVVAWYESLMPAAQKGGFELIENEVVVVDTETTGLDYHRDNLIEIAASRVRGNTVIDTFHTMVNPGCHIPEDISNLTGIYDADVIDAPDPSLAVELFARFAGDCDLVAHNASFDKNIIMRQAAPGMLIGTWIDTVALSRILLPRLKSHRLADLSDAFHLGSPSHRAADDVDATVQLWILLNAAIHMLEPGLAKTISELGKESSWSLRSLFMHAAAASSSEGVYFSLRENRRQRIQAQPAASTRDDKGILSFPSDDEICHAFSADGLLGKIYPHFEQRPEQLKMALEVTHAFRDGTICGIEAGTGVGKSMAYLVPAALVAQQNDTCIGIATKTNALLDQLIYSELPKLSNALGNLSYIALKGYDHYPCLHKIEGEARTLRETNESTIEMIATLMVFVSQTTWGDLDALNLFWAGVPRYLIEANANDCLKRKCPFYRTCFLHGARKAAQKAHIVVTNHSLLFRDADAKADGTGIGLLPQINDWIVDEAHTAEGEARRQFSVEISAPELNSQLRKLTASRSGVLANIRAAIPNLDGGSALYSVTADIDEQIDQVSTSAFTFFTLVKDLSSSTKNDGDYERTTLWVNDGLRASSAWRILEEPGNKLIDKLSELIVKLRNVISMGEEFDELSSAVAATTGVTCVLQEMTGALQLIMSGSDEDYVYSVELNRNPEKLTESLKAARIDIGSKLEEMFYPNQHSLVYTSATLSLGSSSRGFDYFERGVGLDLIENDRLSTLQLNSHFDYEHNMQIYLPTNMPEPTDRHYQEELAHTLLEIHRVMKGGVLTLFTNRRDMEHLYATLKPLLAAEDLELIAQTKGSSVKSVRDRFIDNKDTSLFALRSFWEGFDAPGETLRCVVISRIPFGLPTEPLTRERERREGRQAWGHYSLPEAIMDLKQAAGRLIRTDTDKGFLILADARLWTKGYGQKFLDAMPTNNIKACDLTDIVADIASKDV